MAAVTPQDMALVADAIRAAEARTDGEIAAIVSEASDSYHDVVLHWSLLLALLPLSIDAAFPSLLVWETDLITGGWDDAPALHPLLLILLVKTVLFFLAGRFVFGLPALRRALTPAATAARRVRRRALMLFRAGTEQRTATATGVLLYLSLAERRAEIVADAAIHARVDSALWGEAMTALVGHVREGRTGEGIAVAIALIGDVLADHFPRGDDPNELPDRLIIL